MQSYIYYILICLTCCIACTNEVNIMPKARMYPKVTYPEKSYKPFNESYCSFTFELPNYAVVEQEKSFFESQPENECWFNLQWPTFNGTLHCSYIPIKNKLEFDSLVNDAFKLVDEHNRKANYRQEERIQNKYGVGGINFEIGGDVASHMQFFLTDSTQHFFRASLYFNDRVNADSIKPIYTFVKADVIHMLETFNWDAE